MTSHQTKLSFRKMTCADVHQVCAIERACFPEDSWTLEMFLSELHTPCATVLLALMPALEFPPLKKDPLDEGTIEEGSEKIVAFAVLWEVAGEVQLNDVAVDPNFRRQGVGRALLQEAFQSAKARGCTCATLEVRPSNTGAIALYESLGFRPVGKRRGYYEDGEDALLMNAVLEAPLWA